MLYILMFVQLGAMFYALRQHKKYQNFANIVPAGIAVQVFGIGAVFVAVLKIVLMFTGENNVREEVRKEVSKAEFVSLWYLGEHLANKHPGKKLTVLIAPGRFADANQKTRIEGLEDGLQGKLTMSLLEVPHVISSGKNRVRAYNYENLNEALKTYPNQEIVVSLIGLPTEFYEMEFWDKENLPLFYSYRGTSIDIDQDIRNNKVTAFITYKPRKKFKADEGQKVDKSEAFFQEYFIFVNKDNIDEMCNKYPSLFFPPLTAATEEK